MTDVTKKLFYGMVWYIPESKKIDSISFLYQPMTSGQPLKIVQRHMAHPVGTYLPRNQFDFTSV